MSSRFFPFAVVPAHARLTAASTSIDQQLVDTFNANNSVLAYVHGIANTDLPALSPEPAWYATFRTRFAETKIHAMKWTNSIVPQLVSLPSGIADFAFSWKMAMSNLDAALDVLRVNPKNAEAQQMVIHLLRGLAGSLGTVKTSLSSFGQQLQAFSGDIAADAVVLRQASADSKTTAGTDAKKVQELVALIAELKKEIADWQTAQTVAAIGAGVLFWFGAILAIFSFGAGLAFGIVGAAAGITIALVAEHKMKTLSGEIKVKQGEMKDIEGQIAVLDALVTHLDELVQLAGKAGDQMMLVLNAWNTLESELAAVVTDLVNAEGDASKLHLDALQRDLRAANSDWETLRAFCLKIAGIKYLQDTPATATLPTTAQTVAA